MATVRTKKRTDAREENKGGKNFREVTRLGQARAAKRNQDSLYSMSKKVTCPACRKFYFHSKDRAGSMERCLLMGSLGQRSWF